MNQLNSQMQGNGHKPPEAWQDVPEGTIDVRGYLDALHRSRGLIASIVVGFTLAVVVISFLLPKTYEATATIVMEAPIDSSATLDATSASRELTTIGGLLTAPVLLNTVAQRVPGATPTGLKSNVHASVSSDANLVSVTAQSSDPEQAARIANTVTAVFLAQRQRFQQGRFDAARRALLRNLHNLNATSGSLVQRATIRQALAELSLREASATSDFRLGVPAQVPTSAVSPRPLWNGLIAFFAALTVGILIALARNQISPRIGSVRELRRLTHLPLLATIPGNRVARHARRRSPPRSSGRRSGAASGDSVSAAAG